MLVDNERLKIIDFGLARKLTDNVECREMLGTPEFVGMLLSVYPYLCLSFCYLCIQWWSGLVVISLGTSVKLCYIKLG